MDCTQEVALEKKRKIHGDGYRYTNKRIQNYTFVSMGFTHMFNTLVTFTKEINI